MKNKNKGNINYKRKKNNNSNKKIKKKSIKKTKKHIGGFPFHRKCSKKKIQKKYQVVFIKKQTGGGEGEAEEAEEIDLDPKCKKTIDDLQKQYHKYIAEWKNFK